MFENVNERTLEVWVYYKLTYEPSAQVSYKLGKSGVGITTLKSDHVGEAILIDGHHIWFYVELMVIMQKISYFLVYRKTGFLHMRKQRRRSASLYPRS